MNHLHLLNSFMRLTIVFLLVSLVASAHASASEKLIRVGYYDFEPLIFADSTGNPKGLFVDILEEVAKRENWQLEYRYGSWNELIRMLNNGRLDLVPCIGYSPERAEKYDFTTEFVVHDWGLIYTAKRNNFTTIFNLNRKRVGGLKGSIYTDGLMKLADEFGIQVNLVEFGSYRDIFAALASGTIDAGICTNIVGGTLDSRFNVERTPIVFAPIHLGYAVSKGNNQDVITRIDDQLRKLKGDSSSLYYRSFHKWLKAGTTSESSLVIWGLGTLTVLILAGSAAQIASERIRRKRRAEMDHRRLSTLIEIGKLSQTDEKGLFDSALTFTVETTESVFGNIFFYKEESREFTLHAWSDNVMPECKIQQPATVFHLDRIGIWGETVRQRRTITVNDFAAPNPLKRGLPEGHVPLKRFMAVPIFDGDTIVAVVGVANKKRPYNRDDENVIHLFMHDLWQIRRRIVAEREKDTWQKMLVQSHSMGLVGQLAGGIAHDFNNILTSIIGYANLSLLPQNSERWKEYSRNIIDLSNRAAHLTQSLLAFSRQQPYMPRDCELNSLVSGMEKMLSRLTTENIRLHVITSSSTIPVHVDENQIIRVIVNLVTNAVQALPDGGEITISTAVRRITPPEGASPGASAGCDCAVVEVSDTGCGIPPENRDHIFEPFYTTREVGRGAGLGLSEAFGIIEKHRGSIMVDSRVGEGSRFSVVLPLRNGSIAEDAVRVDQPLARGNETILLADDSEEIRQIASYILTDFGYSVVATHDGAEAVDLFRQDPARIDLLLFDIQMPFMGGLEAYDHIHRESPDVRCVFMSGYLGSEQIVKLEQRKIPYVRKPLSPKDLLIKIREVLDNE